MWFYILLSIPIYYSLRYLWELIPLGGDRSKRAVFISGCDTGFGRLLALKCARNGIPTFAGCLTEQGEKSLTEETKDWPQKVITVPLDVTCDSSVKAAAKFVEKNLENNDLWAIVNNAGIFSCYGPDAWNTIEDYQLSIDVNLFGIIRCTHAFLPLIKKAKGRIISTSSVAGRVSVPCGAPYAVAKYGVQAYMDTIRMELKVFGIQCSILEPGIFRTPLVDAGHMRARVDKVWNRLDKTTQEEYGESYKNSFTDLWNLHFKSHASDRLDYVVDSYYHAITARYPRNRYRCGWDSILFYNPMAFLPTEIVDGFFHFMAKDAPKPTAVLLDNKKAA